MRWNLRSLLANQIVGTLTLILQLQITVWYVMSMFQNVMFGEFVGGAVSVGGQEKEWTGCLLDNLRAFGIPTDQWTIAAQDADKWYKTVKQGAEVFMTKSIAAERARAALRHAVVCPNVTGGTEEKVTTTTTNMRPEMGSTATTSASSDDEESRSSSLTPASIRSRSTADYCSDDTLSTPPRRARAATRAPIMTRKRRLVQEVEEHLAIGEALYWESGVDLEQQSEKQEGTPRRSRRGEARRRYEDAAGLKRKHQKMAVNLPPMLSTREGKLLAIEVFGSGILKHLPSEDKGPRVGHCSSGFVCGHPVPRGKEGNRWCQTPVRASLQSKMACKHHSQRRRGAGSPSKEKKRYMILSAEFYDQETGQLSWPRVVSHVRSRSFPSELRQRRQVLCLGGHALALIDAKIVLHGFAQCTLFWLAVCRLTRRGYRFSMVTHASKAEFRELLANLRASAAVPPPAKVFSPFVCIDNMSCSGARYYANGYDQICRVF